MRTLTLPAREQRERRALPTSSSLSECCEPRLALLMLESWLWLVLLELPEEEMWASSWEAGTPARTPPADPAAIAPPDDDWDVWPKYGPAGLLLPRLLHSCCATQEKRQHRLLKSTLSLSLFPY